MKTEELECLKNITPSPWNLVRTEKGELELGGGIEQSTGVYSSKGFGLIANVIYKKSNILGDSKKLQKDEFEANAKIIASAPEIAKELFRLQGIIEEMHNKILTQWENDFGSIHSEQPMDAYTVSGFINSLIKQSSLP